MLSSRSTLLLLIAGVIGNHRTAAQALRSGILIAPFEDASSTSRGSAGDLIRFRDSPGSSTDFEIEFEGKIYQDVWSVRLIPFDSSFAPHYVYDALISDETLYRGREEDVRDRASLASGARRLFGYHPYRDHFAGLECHAVHRLESHETDGKTNWPKSLACLEAYLRDFPAGQYRDELDWLGVQLKHAVYEFEGNPAPAVQQVRAFTSYLEQHPRHRLRAEIELTVARLCYVIYEILTVEPPDSGGFTAADKSAYRARAEAIYARLSASTDPAVASRAVVQLYNLRDGRRIYANPNAW